MISQDQVEYYKYCKKHAGNAISRAKCKRYSAKIIRSHDAVLVG